MNVYIFYSKIVIYRNIMKLLYAPEFGGHSAGEMIDIIK
jgi:hypothetical protein